MKLDNALFDNILLQALASPRRRMHFDLRTQAEMPGQAGHDEKPEARQDGNEEAGQDEKPEAWHDKGWEAGLDGGKPVGYDGDADWRDMSQRMLNVMMPETVIPIHRHPETSETVIVCRGAVREEFYDEKGRKIAEFVLESGGDCPGVQVPRGMYHTCVCLVPGSVIFEAKDRPYDPVLTEEFLKVEK